MNDTAAYDPHAWHDDTLYGLGFRIGDPERGDWRSDLVLDIDHIVEWLKLANGRFGFRVAPAELVFHDVTDLKLAVDWGDSGGQVALNRPSIDQIVRRRQDPADQKICLDRPYHRWQILLNWPSGQVIAFGASGYSLKLRAEPRLCEEQSLPSAARPGP